MGNETGKEPNYSAMYQEIYDSKSHRIAAIIKGPARVCPKCNAWRGHEIECEDVTLETLAVMLRQTREQLERSKGQASNYYQRLLKISGKLATVKLENNALRKENNKRKANDDTP